MIRIKFNALDHLFVFTQIEYLLMQLSKVSTRGPRAGVIIFLWGKVFEGVQTMCLNNLANAFLVRSIFLRNLWSRVKLWLWCIFKLFILAFLVRILSSYWCLKTYESYLASNFYQWRHYHRISKVWNSLNLSNPV